MTESTLTTQAIVFEDCSTGLGVKIIGGRKQNNSRDFGIFVRRVLPGGLAAKDGRLKAGDEILEVNGEELTGVTNERAVNLLRKASASNRALLIINRDRQSREDFEELLEVSSVGYSSSASSVIDDNTCDQTGNESFRSSISTTAGQHLANPSQSPLHHLTVDLYSSGDESHEQIIDQLMRSSSNNTETMSTPPSRVPPMHAANAGPSKVMSTAQRTIRNQRILMTPAMTSTPEAAIFTQGNGLSLAPQHTDLHEPSPVSTTSTDLSWHPVAPSPSMFSTGLSDSSPKKAIDVNARMKFEKLIRGLDTLGLKCTPSKQRTLESKLTLDENATVAYGDFVNAVREIFKMPLKGHDITDSLSYYASGDLNTSSLQSTLYRNEVQPNHSTDAASTDMITDLRNEQVELQTEINQLRAQLREKDRAMNMLEEELAETKQELRELFSETRNLKNQVHLSEQATKEARDVERNYEEVIRCLEQEVRTAGEKVLENPALQKRLAILLSQLRKAEASKKRFEVSTDQLLLFAERVQEVLFADQSRSDGNMRGPPPPTYNTKAQLLGNTAKQLAQDAQRVVKTVRALIEEEPLPFGWEEAFTEDGMKYYVNHITQVTTWTHPVSQVDHTSGNMTRPPTIKYQPKIHLSVDQPSVLGQRLV